MAKAYGLSLETCRGMEFLHLLVDKTRLPGEISREEFTGGTAFRTAFKSAGGAPGVPVSKAVSKSVSKSDAEVQLSTLASSVRVPALSSKGMLGLAEFVFRFNLDSASAKNHDVEMIGGLMEVLLEGQSSKVMKIQVRITNYETRQRSPREERR